MGCVVDFVCDGCLYVGFSGYGCSDVGECCYLEIVVDGYGVCDWYCLVL